MTDKIKSTLPPKYKSAEITYFKFSLIATMPGLPTIVHNGKEWVKLEPEYDIWSQLKIVNNYTIIEEPRQFEFTVMCDKSIW
jgi:hypothetical protein